MSSDPTVPDRPSGLARTADTRASTPVSDRGALDRGVCVDRYVIVDRIGAGGMGIVYAAYDPELDRRVAIKLVRAHGSAEHRRVARDRLLREAQALAQLSHPNVVSVYDAGTYGEDVFLAMELVTGRSFAEALQAGSLSRAEVRHVLLAAGNGLAAAHRAGLVHRDIKPSNIGLGDDGRVRVLDFGLVRAAADEGEDRGSPSSSLSGDSQGESRLRTPLTELGTAPGTPAYMAPESYVSDVADELSDQFAFCVMAFEALYGERPFGGADREQLRDAIVVGTPKVPDGVRVPRRLRRVLLRGLAKQPGDRYPSMDALLAELGAAPLVTPARAVAVVAVATALVAGGFAVTGPRAPALCSSAASELAGVWDDGVEAEVRASFDATGARYASSSFDRVAVMLDDYAASWVDMRDEACRATRVRGVQSEQLLDLRTACLDRRRQQLGALVQVLAHDADEDVVNKAASAVAALPPLSTCADVVALTAAVPPPDDPVIAGRVRGLTVELDRASALIDAGRYAVASKLTERLIADADAIGYDHSRAEANLLDGLARVRAGDGKGAEPPLRAAVLAAARARDDYLTAHAWSVLVYAIGRQGRLDDALLVGDAARVAVERAGNDTVLRSTLLSNLGGILNQLERYEESERMFAEAIELRERAGAIDDPQYASILSNMGNSLSEQGRYDEARGYYDRAIEVWQRTLGPDHPQIGIPLNNLGNSLSDQGKYDVAMQYYQQAIDQWERSLGPDSSLLAYPLNGMGGALLEQHRYDDAWPYLWRAYELSKASLGPDHPDVGMAVGNLGEVRLAQHRYEDALRYFEESLALQEGGLGSEHPALSFPLTGMGLSLLGLDQPDRALPLLERAWRLREPAHPAPVEAATTEFALAKALWRTGSNRARARALARSAVARLGDAPAWKPMRDEIAAWQARPD